MNSPFYYIYNNHNKFNPPFTFRTIFLFFSIFLITGLQAKTVTLGTGSGSVSQTTMTGLNAGDTLAITPGTYSGGGTFSNLHDLTIINNGGVVNFTGTVIWGGNTMHNIKWTGVGFAGAFYGFVFNTATGIYGQTGHTDSTRFDHLDFENASNAAFDFGDSNFGITYNGSSATLKMHCMTFSDLKVFNSSLFLISGYNDPQAANNNICDSIDMHNIIIQDLQGPGQQVRGSFTHFNMYKWYITYSGTNTLVGDQGILYINGNGSIHDNYMHGGRGYLARIVSFSLKPLQDSVLFYNNILLSTTHYGGLDIRCDSVDIPWRTSPILNPIKNVYVVNNTIGNKWNQGFVVPVVVQYQMHNNNILYCKNNLSFAADPNVTNLPADGILVDFNQGGGKIDTSNNRYFSAAAILSYLQDTLATCRPKSNSALNGGGVPQNFLITDFYDKIRPTPPAIGAVEYAGISSTVIANAGPNQTITLPLDSASLTGLASTAINSTISSYLWLQISGPTVAKLGTPNLGTTMASTLKAGIYVFGLKVKNSNNDSSGAAVTITVNPQNFPPVVSAGANQTITLPTSTITLTGTATDATGTIASYLWTEVSGPNTATIASSTAISSVVSGLIAGTYLFQLKATNNFGLSGTGTITIIVNPATPTNLPPVVNAGVSQTITLPTSTVTLTGTATDATGTIASYLWTELSGPNTATIASNAAISSVVSGLVAGVYTFQLKATDNLGLSGTGSVTIIVNPVTPVNLPPVVSAGTSQTITLPTSRVTLTGIATDATGTIASYLWTEVSGPNTATIASNKAISSVVSGLIAGSYVFQLKATDNLGLSGTATVIIIVNPATTTNLAPVVNAGTSQTITLPTSSVTLSGTATPSARRTIASYLWTEVTGPNTATIASNAARTSVVSGLIAGTYVFQLKATDNTGLSGTGTVTVIVNPAAPVNLPPVVSAGANQTITLPTSSVTLTGTATDATGTITSYLWTEVSGPNTAIIASNASISSVVSGLIAGTYVFQLIATDNLGLSGIGSITIIVNPVSIGNLPPIANAGTDQNITAPVSIISVDGSLSTDPDGSIATFSWSQVSGPSNSTITDPNAAKSTISALVPGIYIFKLIVTDNLGLSSLAQITINVNVATAIYPTPIGSTETLLVYPNPATSIMNVEVANSAIGAMTISVIDVRGNLILTEKVNKNSTRLVTPINVSQLASGTYFLLSNFNKSKNMNTKFLKQ